MAIDLLVKSQGITNRDATPRVFNNPGRGAYATEKVVSDYATVTAALSITSRIRLVAVPSNAVITDMKFRAGAQGAGKFDLGVYRNTVDGGGEAFSGSASYFASAIDCASAVVLTDELDESTTNTLAKQHQPLWQAIGMAADPGTTLDIVATVVTTDVTTGGTNIGVKVRFADHG
jgi:hypothetical protein